MTELLDFLPQFQRIFERTPQLSDVKPSEWAEKNIIIPGGKGRLNYDFNPYCREIIDMMAPDHPMRKAAIMKGSQITFSSGVIMPALGYIISEDPHNTYLMVGTQELVKMAVEKLDMMIHGAKLQDFISYQVQKKRNTKTGDTDEIKSFINGYIKTGSATNPKSIAQVDLERIFLDDFDAMKGKSKEAGDFLKLIEMRTAANMNTSKIMMISTPLVKGLSNIEKAYEKGDRRRYFVNCPCCYEPIVLKWSVKEGDIINPLDGYAAAGGGGIHYEVNNHGQLVKSKVGYICYRCAGFFKDNGKQQLLREANWIPTAIPFSDDYYSYHISSLYAPVGMFDWAKYANDYIEANPPNQPRDEHAMQVLTNTCWGETYEPITESPKANAIQKNIRNYNPGEIPEKLSMADGNGRIVLITCAADMNGKVDDARLDYEILAHSEKGATYSIMHGSIGTFKRGVSVEEDDAERQRWTYEKDRQYSVFPKFTEVIQQVFVTDTGRQMTIMKTGLDCGYFSANYAYPYVDSTRNVIGLKGKGEEEYLRLNKDVKYFNPSPSRPNLYILTVGRFKDDIAENMQLNWTDTEPCQPAGFMNYPHASGGLYEFSSYFEHYEGEHPVMVANKDGGAQYRWEKKNSAVVNHFFDTRVYNMAMREIILFLFAKELKVPKLTWNEWAGMMAQGIEQTIKLANR